MSVPVRLAAFALAVAASVGIGAVVGTAVGPIEVRDAPAEHPVPTPDEHGGSHDG
jgi:hypothetical protein